MLRILALCLPTLLLFSGFIALFLLQSLVGLLLALAFIGIGGLTLWWVEKKTIHHLDEDTWFNNILNTEEGQK